MLLRSLGAIAVAVVFLAANGGYVYKTTCPLPAGGKESSWTYAINDILPYIRQTSAPCESHTATRLLLSAVGIARLGSRHAASNPSSSGVADTRIVKSLAAATSAIDAEFARERRDVTAWKAAHPAGFVTTADVMSYEALLQRGATGLGDIQRSLAGSQPALDSRVSLASNLLSRWLSLQIEGDSVFAKSHSVAEVKIRTASIAKQIHAVTQRLRSAVIDVQTLYPDVTGWGGVP